MKLLWITLFLASLNSYAAVEAPQSELGKGVLLYDKAAGLKDECVNFDSEKVVTEDARITSYSLTLVKNREELYDKITFSTSGSGSYGTFSASAKTNFVKEVQWNYNSNYILVRATRITKKQSMNVSNVLIKDQSLNVLRDSTFQFLESCGNSFATAIELGGEIYGLIEIKASTYEEKQRIELSISGSGSYGLGSAQGKADYERTIRKLTSDYKAKVDFQHVGGGQIEVPNTVEGLLELSNRIEAISDLVPVPLNVLTREYSTISNYLLDKDPEIQVRQNNIDWAQKQLEAARGLYARIIYVLENQRDFKGFSEAVLSKKLVYLDDKIIDLKNFIARSYRFANQSDRSSLNLDLSVSLPQMRNRAERRPLKVTCEVRPSTLCGVETYREQKSSACGVVGPKVGSGPVCGAVYKEMKSAECGVFQYNLSRGPVCGVALYESCYHGRSRYGRARPHGRDSSCGVELYKECRDPAFGVAEFNSCRHPNHGIEKYNTCNSKEFGYEFETCRHFSHGPDQNKSCEVATVGTQETYCPKF
jgi:hypothetical protein